MVVSTGGAGRTHRVIGFHEFLARFNPARDEYDPAFARWFNKLENDLLLLGRPGGYDAHGERLMHLQHALVELLRVVSKSPGSRWGFSEVGPRNVETLKLLPPPAGAASLQ